MTVAVQVAAGTAAIASASRSWAPYRAGDLSVGIILLMCFGNLRGLKEAGRAFAVPTYLFAGSVILMIIVGLIREAAGNLPSTTRTRCPVTSGSARHQRPDRGAMIFTLLKAFANGGASLTGIEAVSDAVGAFRPPEGRNARQVLVTEGLHPRDPGGWASRGSRTSRTRRRGLAGTRRSWPRKPSSSSGTRSSGKALFILVQAATALILYTGGNTSFNGFPFLTSFVAGDAFLPRWLLKRGHRLVFSNGIIVLTVLSVALLIIKKANVNDLVPLYAIGVFTAFTMAGFGMARYHLRRKEPGWRRKFIINFSAGVLTTIVVGIFADREVHRGRLAGPGPLRDPGPGAHPAQPRVPDGVGSAGGHHRRPAAAAADTTRGARCSSSWTASTWPRWPPCGTRAACGPRRCARSTS